MKERPRQREGGRILFWPKIRSKGLAKGPAVTEVIVSKLGRVVPWMVGIVIAGAAAPAQAQSNLDAGKSAAQIFSDTCNACHRSPRELRQTNAGFLREHYTTGGQEAAAMAAYLASIGSDVRAVRQRRPPALGAGQAAGTETAPRPATPPGSDQGKPPESQAALPATAPGHRTATTTESSPAAAVKPRRPSESVEAGKLPLVAQGGAETAAPPAAVATPPAPNAAEAFEE
jgi:hypothetical protein